MAEAFKQKRQNTPEKSQGNPVKKLFKLNTTVTGMKKCEKMNVKSSEGPSDSEREMQCEAADPAPLIGQDATDESAMGKMMALFQRSFKEFEDRFDKKFDSVVEVMHDVKEALLFHEKECDEKFKKIEKELECVYQKLDDLENRSRRNNLVFFGIPEGKEKGEANMTAYMEKFLLAMEPGIKLDIQRAHRTPSGPPPQKSGGRKPLAPRPIHVAFGSYPVKETIKKACIRRFKEASSKGSEHEKMYVDDDLSQRIRAQRKKMLPELQKLRRAGKKAFFVYPAQIKYYEGERLQTLKQKD